MSDSALRITLFMKSLAAGGAERIMLTLAKGFIERGFLVDFIVCDASGHLRAMVPHEVNLVDLGGGRLLRCFPALVRYLRRAQPVAMLSTLVHTNIAAVWATRLTSQRPRLVLRAATVLSASLANRSRIDRLLLPLLVHYSYSRSDAIIAVSDGVAVDLIERFRIPARQITTVPNPVITEELLQRGEEAIAHPWFDDERTPVVLGVGRLTPAKRFDLLLNAFSLLRVGRTARLLIIGEGEEEESLKSKAEELGLGAEDVSFLGHVSNPAAYMARADLLALTSDYEGSPGVLVEALAVGCPVVSTDSPGGSGEILQGGALGHLVPSGDAEALSAAMAEVLASPPDADVLRASAQQRYSSDINIERYLGVLLPQREPGGAQPDGGTEDAQHRRGTRTAATGGERLR